MPTKAEIQFVRSLRDKKQREVHKLFVAEGSKLISDLISKGLQPKILAGAKAWFDNFSLPLDMNITQLVVSEDQMAKMSSFKSPSEALAVFPIPEQRPFWEFFPKNEIIIGLDNIQDPGNLGTIVRTADWFGFRNFLASPATVDRFNPKVVQASMGSICSVHLWYTPLLSIIQQIKKKFQTPVYGAFMTGENLFSSQIKPPAILLFGSEGSGLSKELLPVLDKRISIPPMAPDQMFSESLNVSVAASLFMAEIRRTNPG